VVYFGWNSFDPMRPAVPGAKKDKALAAFISNCGARSFRNLAVGALMAPEANLTVESYGACMRNMVGPWLVSLHNEWHWLAPAMIAAMIAAMLADRVCITDSVGQAQW
jgi:hypothetical protein